MDPSRQSRGFDCLISFSANAAENWGEAFNDNHTGTGLVGHVIERRADIAAGAIYHWLSTYPFLKYSDSIQKTRLLHLVPVAKPLPTYLIPVLPFPLSVWASIVVTYFAGSVFIFIAKTLVFNWFGDHGGKRFKFQDSVLMVLKCALFEGVERIR